MKQNKEKPAVFPGKTVIGITGGIGAGKSTVLNYISGHYDVFVIMADETGRELMKPGKSVYLALVAAYGEEILLPDKTINTAVLSEIAFKDEESQKKINEIEHPIIKEEIIREIGASDKRIVFVEAALLSEGGLLEICDHVVSVTARRLVRIGRLKKNRGYTLKKSRSILKRQLSDREFKKISDTVIKNNGNFSRTKRAADQMMERILSK